MHEEIQTQDQKKKNKNVRLNVLNQITIIIYSDIALNRSMMKVIYI